MGSSLENKVLVNGRDKLKFEFVLNDGIFVFKAKDDINDIRYIVNNCGEVIYECGKSFPFFVDGNLILINDKDEEINIIHNFLEDRDKYTIIKKQGIVLSKPQYYNGNIVIVVDGFILILDVDLNMKKSISYNINEPIIDTLIDKDLFYMIINLKDKSHIVCIDLISEIIREYDSSELLPNNLSIDNGALVLKKKSDI